mgnify:FL=1
MEKVILKNIAGNFYGVGVNLFSQIVLVPFFITYWGIDLYADWIALTAISSFFSMSDIGLNTVTANQYSICYNNGNEKKCNSLLANNIILILSIWVLCIIIGTIVFKIVDIKNVMNLRIVSSQTGYAVLFLLISKIFISMLSSVYTAIYRAKSMAYKTFFISNTSRLLDALILLVGILLNLNIALIAFLYCIPSILQFFYYAVDSRLRYNSKIHLKAFDFKLFKKILVPSVSFMSFPLGYAIIMQGFTLIVNKFFGAESVVLYNTTRTICNFLKVIPNAIKNATWPEFTIAFAKSNTLRMMNLYKKTIILSLLFVILAAITLLTFGDVIYQIWTKNAVEFNFLLMLTYMTSIFFNSVWETSGMALMATNRHTRLGILFVCLSGLSFLLAISIAPHINSLIPIVFCILLTDMLLSMYTLRKSKRLIYNKV